MLIPLTLLMLAADTKPAPPKTAPLSENAKLVIQNHGLRFELLKREMADLQRANEEAVRKACADAGFAKCHIDMEKGVVVEEKP
jgi:hypothetical protein